LAIAALEFRAGSQAPQNRFSNQAHRIGSFAFGQVRRLHRLEPAWSWSFNVTIFVRM
jgi:hypothetical protein